MHDPSPRTPAALAVLAVLGSAFIAVPLAALLIRAPWSQLASELSASGAWIALRLSIEVSLIAAALSFVLGVPVAWVLARARLPGRSILRAVVIQLTFTTAGAVLATTFVSIPLVILAVEAGLRSLDPRYEQAAAAMGASSAYVLRRVTLPLIRPQLVAGVALAWARALGEFGATITFAGNLAGRTQTLPLAVYQARQTDPGAAVLTSLLLVALSLIVLVAMRDRIFAR
jgi:molybdate transport system permease protein